MLKNLYVHRNVLNTKDFIKFYDTQGLKLDNALHITICFSTAKVDWEAITKPERNIVQINSSLLRKHDVFGKKLVLRLNLTSLTMRHKEFKKHGASFDFPTYQPHISLIDVDNLSNVSKIKPYTGKILLGAEIYEEIKED
jgi:hypothetical protein